ncbi:MAG: hypothetical protein M0R77_14455 [Gammaproteobacteria bacterium]|nr:hypothetical protein [Gammaproteobacteria bacterium]
MDTGFRVVYQGKLRRGQTRSGVAGRLSEALGRDRVALEKLLDGPSQVLLAGASERTAARLAEIFIQAGAEVRIEGPGDAESTPTQLTSDTPAAYRKPSVPPSFGQRVWLVRAAFVLSVIALLGVLVIGLLAASLVTLAFSLGWLIEQVPWPAVVVPVYAVSMTVLVLTIAGLVKPFVRVQSHLPMAIPLERANEPELFEFIAYVCEAIHVPYPQGVLLDMSASVKAGRQPGSTLTIGLPVLASVSTAELGGLLARAFTLHISGSTGRMARFVVTAVQILHEAVHGRDLFDSALERGLQSRYAPVRFAAREAAVLLRLSRSLLGHLLREAIGTSAAAMRSIEWHGDRHQAWIVGAETFARSIRRMRLVGFAADRAAAASQELWRKGRPLPADLAGALQARLGVLAKSGLAKVVAAAEIEQEAVAEFHLADARRIERIRQGAFEPVITCGTPARELVRGYALLTRRMTMLHYRNGLGLPATPVKLQTRTSTAQPVVDAFSGGAFADAMPISPLRSIDRTRTTRELVAEARALRAATAAGGTDTRRILEQRDAVADELIRALHEELMQRSGTSTRRSREALESVQIRCRELEAALEKATRDLTPQGERISRRIANAIALLERPETAARLPGARGLAARGLALCETLDKLQSQMTLLHELEIHLGVLELLLTAPERGRAGLKDRIVEQQAEIGNRLTAIRIATGRLRNPLDEKTQVFEHLRTGWVPTHARYLELDEAAVVLNGLLDLRKQIVARLALLVRAAEDAWLAVEGAA